MACLPFPHVVRGTLEREISNLLRSSPRRKEVFVDVTPKVEQSETRNEPELRPEDCVDLW